MWKEKHTASIFNAEVNGGGRVVGSTWGEGVVTHWQGYRAKGMRPCAGW